MDPMDELKNDVERLKQDMARIAPLITATGDLHPDIFTMHSQGFSLLPHECASIRFSSQAIANNSSVVPTGDANGSNNAAWANGFRVSPSSAEIHITGLPMQSVFLFTAWWNWDANSSGQRWLKWEDNNGNAVTDYRTANSIASMPTMNFVSHVRQAALTDTTYRITLFQNSGANLSGDGLFTAVRLR